jgi:carbamoyltransferase
MKKNIYTLGINSTYHEPAACLVKNGEVIAGIEEERFNRYRHGKKCSIDNPHELPYESIDFCLKKGGIKFNELDKVAFSFNPEERLKRNRGLDKKAIPGDWGTEDGEKKFYDLCMSIPSILEKKYQTDLNGKWHWLPHHLAHAASTYYESPFDEAAVLTIDGIGEFCSISFGHGQGSMFKLTDELGAYPSSLGFLWTKASRFLNVLIHGMGEYGAGKIMALASYGDPERFYDTFRSFVHYDEEGNFKIDGDVFQFREGNHSKYEELFGFKARSEGEKLSKVHMDFAAAMQRITNEVMLGLVNALYKKTKAKNLCIAGGVSLNCTANSHILKNGPFEKIYIQPGANDMGTALGAAQYICHEELEGKYKIPRTKFANSRWNLHSIKKITTPYLGPEFSNDEIEKILMENEEVEYLKISCIESVVASLIEKGAVIAWFQGRTEFGPRALGNRSIIADPRINNNFKRVSQEVKSREWFRPLAPAVMEEHVDEWFTRPGQVAVSDRWMLFAYKVKPEKIGQIPAVTHHDNTSRIQSVSKETNERFYKLINEFYKLSGVPIIVNTSFNIREPIVNTPEEAVATFLRSKGSIDFLAIGDFLVARAGTDIELATKLNKGMKTVFEHWR